MLTVFVHKIIRVHNIYRYVKLMDNSWNNVFSIAMATIT